MKRSSKRSRFRALVTGGAGLIGSHIVDRLLTEECFVRVFDSLEPQTHPNGRPGWSRIAEDRGAEFVQGDVRDRSALAAALRDIDVVFHQAAYGGFMPEIAKFVQINSFGTAQLLEVIRDEKFPVRKVIVASSQVVYPEGAAECPTHGLKYPPIRPTEQLRRGDFEVHCPECGQITRSLPTPESAPLAGETVYAITKVDQEKLLLLWGRQTGIPTLALRYPCTYGPRQSIFNPYTGVIAIFCTRLLNGLPPVIYEDGEQTRDFGFVEDVALANWLVANTDSLDGQAINVGSGEAASIKRIAKLAADALSVQLEPVLNGEFRPGEIRHLIPEIGLIRSIGYTPQVKLEEGIVRYLDWIRSQGSIKEYFAAAEPILRAKGMLQKVGEERNGETARRRRGDSTS